MNLVLLFLFVNFGIYVLICFYSLSEKMNVDVVSVCRWSFRFIKSFAMGELEARKLKFNSTGTEALLMGILVEGKSI